MGCSNGHGPTRKPGGGHGDFRHRNRNGGRPSAGLGGNGGYRHQTPSLGSIHHATTHAGGVVIDIKTRKLRRAADAVESGSST